MLRKIYIIIVLLLVPGLLYGAEKFGMVFDVKGDVVITSASGKTIKLNKKQHLLLPVKDGDRIEVKKGKVLIVSLKDNQGYEILSNSVVVIRDRKLKAIKGVVNVKSGYTIPAASAGGPIGVIVIRDKVVDSCIKTVSPVNTAILNLTPELKWKLNCKGAGKRVSIKVLYGRDIIYGSSTEENSVKVPEGVLKYGETYAWLVDGGPYGIIGGTFSIPEEDEVNRIKKKIDYYKDVSDLSQRLSYVFYLLSNNLNEFADLQIQTLKKEYPENDYIKALK